MEKAKKVVSLISPIKQESKLSIEEIMDLLVKHFYYPYKSRGASILPVVALYSVYECITREATRYNGKVLEPLGSHNSCDKSSGAAGDIVIRETNGELYEVVEVKFDIPIDGIMVMDAYNKIKPTKIQRYYILSTCSVKEEDREGIRLLTYQIRMEHGCQLITNGVLSTLNYYLRMLENTDQFIECYIRNLEKHSELNYEHKIAWNTIMKKENINK